VKCEVFLDNWHYLTFECGIFSHKAFINDERKEEILGGIHTVDFTSSEGMTFSIFYIDSHAYIEFPPTFKWPICLDSKAYKTLKEKLNIPSVQGSRGFFTLSLNEKSK
jgi:hypothetical protein